MGTFGERLKQLRNCKHLTQEQLSDKLEISRSALGMYETGKRKPDFELEEKVADFFNVTIDYLRGRTNYINCPICYHRYNPLDEYDSREHDILHKRFIAAENKYGQILLYGDASQKRDNAISKLYNYNLSSEEKISAFQDYLKYSFMISIWNSNFDLTHETFEVFCKKEMGLAITKEALDNIGDDVYQRLVDKYGVAHESDYHKVVELTPKDNRDIKKNLDCIMEQLSSHEYGPAAYDGEELSEESVALFKDELEIALKRLKLINKEKYNPNKNKK